MVYLWKNPPLGFHEAGFGNEPQMMHDPAWSEKFLFAVLGVLILGVVVQIALKYVH